MRLPFKSKTLVAALAATLPGIGTAQALSFGMDFSSYFTMLSPNGTPVQNSDYIDEPRFGGWRTPVQGKMVMDIGFNGLVGSATFTPFSFFGGGVAVGQGVSFVPAKTLLGILPATTLLVGNMGFSWNGNNGIPVSLVFDIANLQTALMSSSLSGVIGGLLRPASDDALFNGQLMPIGPSVVVTTEWNTTNVDTDKNGTPGPIALGHNPSGTVPLVADMAMNSNNNTIGIAGSPMRTAPFPGFNANFDINSVTVRCINLLGSCNTGGIQLPPLLTLNPAPLDPLLKGLSGLLRGLGL